MQPDRILSYASDGLTAALYRGRYAPPSDRIVIMLGGSDGSYALTQTYADDSAADFLENEAVVVLQAVNRKNIARFAQTIFR